MLRSRIRPSTSEVSTTRRDGRSPVDWKGWVILAWVLWSGLSYAKMVLAQRSDRISGLVTLLMNAL